MKKQAPRKKSVSICVGMKSFSNWRWANREVWYNVLGRVKVKQRVKDESDMDESSEHDIKFFKT